MKKFIIFLLSVLLLGMIIYGLQYYFQIFDMEYLGEINEELTLINKIINNEIITGISIGTLLFIVMLLIIPIFAKDINTKSYFKKH